MMSARYSDLFASASAPYRRCKHEFVQAGAARPSRAVELGTLASFDPRLVKRLEGSSILERDDEGRYWLAQVHAASSLCVNVDVGQPFTPSLV